MSDVNQNLGSVRKKKGVKVVLLILVVLMAIILLTEILDLTKNGGIQAAVAIFAGVSAVLMIIALILPIILFCIWIFAFHSDLKIIDASYEIRPGQAIARILIPGYNLWGIWNIHSTYGKWLQSKPAQQTKDSGAIIWKLLPLYYVCLIIGQVFDRIASRSGISDEIKAWLGIVGSVITLGYLITWLTLVDTMQGTLSAEKAKEKEQTQTI